MTEGNRDEETGFGIGSSRHGDVWLVIEVDPASQTVTVLKNGKASRDYSFEEFIQLKNKEE